MGEISDFPPPARCRFAAAVRAIGAGICLLAAGSAASAPADPLPIKEAKSLAAANADKPVRVRVRGVVTLERDNGNALFLQDATDGVFAISVRPPATGNFPENVRVAAEVEAEGLVMRGGFTPYLALEGLRVIGSAPLPEPIVTTPDRFFSGAEDCRLVSVTGHVRDVAAEPHQWRLVAETSLRTFEVEIARSAMPPDFGLTLDSLPDASVRFIGVAATAFNPRGELLWPVVCVSKPEWITVVEPARAAPFAAPYLPLDSLARYRQEPPPGHRIRTAGTVVHAIAGQSIFLQENLYGTLVRTRSNLRVRPGDRVEAAGFVDRRGSVACLAQAVIRVVSSGVPPQPVAVAADEIIAIQNRAYRNYVRAEPGDYEGCLVTFHGTLLEKTATGAGMTLLLVAGNTPIAAVLGDDRPGFATRLAAGSELSVTGILQGLYEQSPERWPLKPPARLTLLLRSPADVRLVRAAPWWTRQRLAVAAGGLAVFAVAASGWAGMLRREVRRQTAIAVAEETARREAAAEYEATLRERSRLAANLHDTILQTVTGIGFQLKAGVASQADAAGAERLFDHVALAQKMVDHAASQLRGTVWSLRSLPLDGSTFSEALEALVQRLGERQETRIEVAVSGPADDVPDVVAGNLLLVIQEAIHNALIHGAPKLICVRVACGPTGGIAIEVRDDGSGFDPASRAGPSTGHFGLEGMRERMERLHGTLAIESRPGGGTAVRGTIAGPARAHHLPDRDHLPDRAMGEAVG